MAEIEVLKSGFYTSIQDLGRTGFARYGVPQSGVMDSFSAKKANLLLDNKSDAAVLEITMSGPKLKFSGDTTIAICGAEFTLQLNGKEIFNDKLYVIKEGDELDFGTLKAGFRAYLAVFGGFLSDKILGSRSMYEGITSTIRLQKGDRLCVKSGEIGQKSASARVNFRESGIFKNEIEVFTGPEFGLLSKIQQKTLFSQFFTVSGASSRMAIQLVDKLQNQLKGIVTGPVIPGTVQLTSGGNLIILMRDCQVTGGYPRILQLSEMSICRLAQKRPQDLIKFKLRETGIF
ncbi:MAG: biotin-dependent carboxyltransferase family protein [Leeuwenhoekiella sp.]